MGKRMAIVRPSWMICAVLAATVFGGTDLRTQVPKRYFAVLLLRTSDTVLSQEASAGHLAGLLKLNKAGDVATFGPFTDGGAPSELVAAYASDEDGVRKLFAADRWIAANKIRLDIIPLTDVKGSFGTAEIPPKPQQLIVAFFSRALPPSELLPGGASKVLLSANADRGDWRQMIVFGTPNADDVRALYADHSDVKAGKTTVTTRPWLTFSGLLR